MLRLQGVTKRFGRVSAIEDVSFELGDRGIVGLLGPNGAGKSTTMRMIVGALAPSAGRIWIGGQEMRTEMASARRLLGYLPETAPLYADMTVGGFLEFAARLRGIRGREASRAARTAAERCAIADRFGFQIHNLSRGQRQRVGIAQAIVHRPKLLVLDEPTNSLDPEQIVEVRRLIDDLAREHVILISSHNLSEVGALCARVLVLRDGHLVKDQPIDEQAKSAGVVIRLRVANPVQEVHARLAQVQCVRRVQTEGKYLLLDIAPGVDASRAITALIHEAGWTLQHLDTLTPALEALFGRSEPMDRS